AARRQVLQSRCECAASHPLENHDVSRQGRSLRPLAFGRALCAMHRSKTQAAGAWWTSQDGAYRREILAADQEVLRGLRLTAQQCKDDGLTSVALLSLYLSLSSRHDETRKQVDRAGPVLAKYPAPFNGKAAGRYLLTVHCLWSGRNFFQRRLALCAVGN